MSDSRHPYTYSCDFIRALGPVSREGVVLSRSDASKIREGIAKAIKMDDEELAVLLSYAEQAKTQEVREGEARKIMAGLGLAL